MGCSFLPPLQGTRCSPRQIRRPQVSRTRLHRAGLVGKSSVLSMADLTQLLATVRTEELLPLVYDELRRMAAVRLSREQPGQTLQATALVHEAWLRLEKNTDDRWKNRAHFFAAAGEAMRRILVDSARRKAQQKRGGNPDRVDLPESQIIAPGPDDKLLQVHEVLDELAATDPLKADIVKLRYFVGLNHQEIAEAFELNEKTVRRHWELARVRLYELIAGADSSAAVGNHGPGRPPRPMAPDAVPPRA